MNDDRERLIGKIKTLNECVWSGAISNIGLEKWISNFPDPREQLAALHLLSHYMYFGWREIRGLLREMFLELFALPLVRDFRKRQQDTMDLQVVSEFYRTLLRKTRIFGIGNPSESGQHLLYYLRQELGLPKEVFENTHRIFTRDSNKRQRLRREDIDHFIFFDDFCGSGQQAVEYSEDIVNDLKTLAPQATAYYFTMFATDVGLKNVRSKCRYDSVQAAVELDSSYKAFEGERYFTQSPAGITREYCKDMALKYGKKLAPQQPLGYKDGQLLLGFFHNTPDNTLPIIWSRGSCNLVWNAAFPRYTKIYEF